MQIFPLSPNEGLRQKTIEYASACPREAGPLLAQQMQEHNFFDWERVFVAVDGDMIAGFCTFTREDGIPNVPYTPYIGYIFVDENYRGQRLSEQMIETVIHYARTLEFGKVYIVSDHINLYEKYGFTKIDEKTDCRGNKESIYFRPIV